MYEALNQPIEVLISFTKNGPIPTSFIWKKKEYYIQELNFIYKEKRGNETIHYFMVSDDSAAYKLCFETESLRWLLMEVYDTLQPENGVSAVKERITITYARQNNITC
ncbi:hypothetical protein H6802_04215 [Candidatus Nomurabacteria bacterium]|uniref:Uncharacterized protein n=1 Tax=candidate division WWE3 bacterium TaxID=2053526 RepID=A0A955E0U8_UNCKA|nr:hypothetical protein [candidate division WWE3 bacterium]MCB9824123.1 hypothetical protein [Candidatus Nomurabacteria bacterium]MCB9826906.1 hypothetical protein [Candidatus Nomurabacteria bacterium]MCB9828064.1 hypothetical protein [Candidatus Nomurabacteria bacterium]HXK52880.1 hypothetical protein [bacterium]